MESLSVSRRVIDKLMGWLWPPEPQGRLLPWELAESIRSQDRRQHDAMPAQWDRRPLAFHAVKWITAHKELPKVKGRLK